eukprot:gene2992-3449_t
MLQRNFLIKLNGVSLQQLNLHPSKIGLLQVCLNSKVFLPCREKTSLFPKPRKSAKDEYDFESEMGGRPKKKVPYSTPLPAGDMPDMPYEQPINIDTVGGFISEYSPLEKKAFLLTPTGIKQRFEAFKMFLISTYRKDKDRLNDLVVRNMYAGLKQQFLDANKRIYWRFIKSIKPPRIVHARVAPIQEKKNLFAQVTVKLHTEQILAITDNHGRKLKGDKKKSKEVIDYVVLERHLVNPYGQWKVIGKLMPQKLVPSKDFTAVKIRKKSEMK